MSTATPDIQNISSTEKQYLCYFASLPLKKWTIPELIELFDIPDESQVNFFDSIYDLSKTGWLQRENGLYSMPFEMQLHTRRKIRPTYEQCEYLFDTIIQKLELSANENKKPNHEYISYAESLLDVLPEENLETALLATQLIEAHRQLNQNDKALQYNQKYINIVEKILDNNHPEVANSYFSMAMTYTRLRMFEKAVEFNMKAASIYEQNNEANDIEKAANYSNLSINYYQLKNYSKSLEYGYKSVALNDKTSKKNYHLQGITYCNMAMSYYSLKEYKHATDCIDKAIDVHQKVLPFDHPDLKEELLIQHDLHSAYKLYKNLPAIIEISMATLSLLIITVAIYFIYL